MTFKLLHSSDWHLGQHFYGKSRAPEHQQFLTWLLEQITTHQIDAVIVAGDIFDTGTPPSYAREMYFDFAVKVHQLNCQLIILAGNHDSVAMLGESKELLSHLSCTVITAAGDNPEQQVITIKDIQGNAKAVVCAIPYIRPRDALASQAGQSAKDKQQALQQAITEHYQAVYKQAEIVAQGELPIIATGHLTTIGVTSSESVRDIYIGTLEAFPASEFPNADYIALGHIHRKQKVAKTKHIRYCGSPIPLSFDEANQDKAVFVVEFASSNLQQITEVTVPRFQPIVMLKTNLSDLTTDIEALVKTSESEKDKGNIWLDIEIESAEFLADLTARVESIIEHYPVEVLLVRRSKKMRKQMNLAEEKLTLEELNLSDVFNARLDEEEWLDEQALQRKERLSQLFLQTVDNVTNECTGNVEDKESVKS